EVDVLYSGSLTGISLMYINVRFTNGNVTVDYSETDASIDPNYDYSASPGTLPRDVRFQNGSTLSSLPSTLATIYFDMPSGECTDIQFTSKTIMHLSGNCTPNSQNINYCAPAYTIEGQVLRVGDTNGVGGAEVVADPTGTGDDEEDVTNSSGYYELTVQTGSSYDVTASLDGPHNGNGCVTSYDLNALSDHLLGTNTFTEAEEFIAADANGSSTISTLDLLIIRAVVLQTNPSAFHQSWDMTTYSEYNGFANPTTSFPSYSGEYTINNINQSYLGKDFVAIKIGDVNSSCGNGSSLKAESDQSLAKSGKKSIFRLGNARLLVGETAKIPVYALSLQEATVFSIGIQFDQESVEVISIDAGELPYFDENAYRVSPDAPNEVDILWFTQGKKGESLLQA
ncbi:MAG: hypothetical protein KDD15_26035, partial [Lewinella sp.]|nr:hypothetical protein [Lewinella sp.]